MIYRLFKIRTIFFFKKVAHEQFSLAKTELFSYPIVMVVAILNT